MFHRTREEEIMWIVNPYFLVDAVKYFKTKSETEGFVWLVNSRCILLL